MKKGVIFSFLLPFALAFTPYFPSLPTDARSQAVLLLMVCTLLVLAAGLIRGGRLAFAVVAVALPLTYVLLWAVSQLGGQPPAGDRAVGYALYTGYPKSRDALYVPLLVGVPVLVAFLMFVFRKHRLAPLPQIGELPPPARRWSGVVFLTLLIMALACYFWPDVRATCPAFSLTSALPWDSSNVFAWQYLFHHGALPWKDFWYPYGGQVLFALDFPLGDLVYALHRFLLFTLFLLATYAVTGRSIPATLAIFGTLFGLTFNNVFELPERYGLVVNVVLTYLAIDRSQARLQMRHLLFWLASVQALVFEPASVLYAGVPLLVCLVLDALRSPSEFWLHLPGRMLREFIPLALALVCLGSFLALRGQLRGFLGFMGSLDTMAAYSAVPVPMLSWLELQPRPESFLLVAVVVLLGVGLVRERIDWQQKNSEGRVILLLGLATALLLLKQFVRPHIAGQLLIVPVAGILFLLFGQRPRRLGQACTAALAAGLLLAPLATSYHCGLMIDQIATVAARLKPTVLSLSLDGVTRRTLTELRFDPRRLLLAPAQMQALAALNGLARQETIQPLFVLSDDPIFYVLTGGRPYFHTNGYNAAPLAEQKRLLKLFQQTPPAFVLWRYTDPGVDNVPPIVRNPLIFEYLIEHYVPESRFPPGPFVLLRRRQAKEDLAIDFWCAYLGYRLPLGHIPRFANRTPLTEPISRIGEAPAEMLTLRVTNFAALAAANVPALPHDGSFAPAGKPLAIPINGGGRTFNLVLWVVPEQADYHVPLWRVWFWGMLQKCGWQPKLGEVGPGVEVRIERCRRNDDVLY